MAVVKVETSRLIVTYVISLFWGVYEFIKALWQIIRKGPSIYFYMKDRSRRPQILDNPDLGTHAFVKLSQVKIVFLIDFSIVIFFIFIKMAFIRF